MQPSAMRRIPDGPASLAVTGHPSTDRPIDIFCGSWKRCLSTRVFGTYSLARDSNTIVHIEATGGYDGLGPQTYAPAYSRPVAPQVALQPPQPYKLRWSFGRTTDAVRAGYTMEPLFEAVGGPAVGGLGSQLNASSSAASRVVPLRVSYAGNECLGTYQPDRGLMMAHLVGHPSTATVIYRIIDEDSE